MTSLFKNGISQFRYLINRKQNNLKTYPIEKKSTYISLLKIYDYLDKNIL